MIYFLHANASLRVLEAETMVSFWSTAFVPKQGDARRVRRSWHRHRRILTVEGRKRIRNVDEVFVKSIFIVGYEACRWSR
jgi:hypothetical protein